MGIECHAFHITANVINGLATPASGEITVNICGAGTINAAVIPTRIDIPADASKIGKP